MSDWFNDSNSDVVHPSKRRKTETGVKRIITIDADGNELIHHEPIFLNEEDDQLMTSHAADESAEITDASLSVEGAWGEQGESA